MTKGSICAYSTADDNYAVHSAVSLLGVRTKNPQIPLFLIGTHFSSKTKRFLEKHNIEPIELDLSDKFHTAWDYPIECYYLFAGPEVLFDRGFEYSIYVDGDVYCNNDPTNVNFAHVKDFAGAFTDSNIAAILGKDAQKAVKIYGNEETLAEKRIQTGIVYFNNKSLAKKEFLNKISAVYQEAIDSDIPRKGDDSLLALFRLAYPTWGYKNLGEAYNKITSNTRYLDHTGWLTKDSKMITDAVFFHFTNHTKPWVNTAKFPTYTHQYFYHAWRRHAVDTLSTAELEAYYPNITALLTDKHLRYYWYPTDNVGDLITPYYLEKACGVKQLDDYKITEHGIRILENESVYSKFIHTRLGKKLNGASSRISSKSKETWSRAKPHVPLNEQISRGILLTRRVKGKLHRVATTSSKKIAGKVSNTVPAVARPKGAYTSAKRALYGVSTGSVIRLCGDHAFVFGSGVRSADQPTHNSLVRAVRGPLTRQRFLDDGNACPPIYGDPGLLLPKYYTPKKAKNTYRIGLIPHFTEFDDIREKYKADKDVLVIDMACGNLEKVIDEIVSCKKTVSSSLHGLVLSHAYGIPTRQIEYSDRIMGDGTKFLDYYGGIGLARLEPVNAEGCKYISPSNLEKIEYESLKEYDPTKLESAMFFDENGFKKSAYYPYA